MESLRSQRRRPSHPGALIREIVLPEIGITQTEFAHRLGVSRRTISELLHERRAMTPDLAIRLSRLIGSSPSLYLRMQAARDIWDAEHADRKKYAKIKKLRLPSKRKAS